MGTPLLFLLVRLSLPSGSHCSEDAGPYNAYSSYGIALYLLLGFAGSSIAVAWHRLLLRNEKPADAVYLDAGGRVRNYYKIAIFLLFLALSPDMLSALLDGEPEYRDSFTQTIACLAAVIIVAPFAARLPVILPARALELNGVTLALGWEKTRRNFSRLAFAQSLCFVPSGLLGYPLSVVFLSNICAHPDISAMAYTSSMLLCVLISGPVYLSFLSLAYRFFFEREETAIAVPGQARMLGN